MGRIVQAISATIEDASQCCTRKKKTPSNATLYADANAHHLTMSLIALCCQWQWLSWQYWH